MNNETISKPDKLKKKVKIVVLCIVLFAAISTGAFYLGNSVASSQTDSTDETNIQSSDGDMHMIESTPGDGNDNEDQESSGSYESSVKDNGMVTTKIGDDGVTYYSYDNGETWTTEAPDGINVENDNGNVNVWFD